MMKNRLLNSTNLIKPFLGLLGMLLVFGRSVAAQQYDPDLEHRLNAATGEAKFPLLHLAFSQIQDFSGDCWIANAGEALQTARALNKPAEEGFAMIVLGHGYYLKGNYQQSLEMYFQSRAIFERIGEVNGVAEAHFKIGNMFYFCFADYPRTLSFYQKALDEFRRAGNATGMTKSLNNIADVYTKLGQYKTAVGHYLEALNICERDHTVNPMFMAGVLGNLCDICLITGDFDQALEYLNRAKAIYDREGHPYGQAGVLCRYGNWYREQHQYDRSIQCYKEALAIRRRIRHQHQIAAALHHLGETYLLKGDLRSAQGYLNEALEIRRRINDTMGVAQTLLGLGRVKKQSGSTRDALTCLQESKDLSEHHAFSKELRDVYFEMSDLYSRLGRFEESLHYKNLYENVQEAVSGSRTTATIMSIIRKYEEQKLGQEINRIKTTHRQTLAFYLTAIGILIIALTILFLAVQRHRRKTKNLVRLKDSEINSQQDQIEVLKEKLHDLEDENNKERYQYSRLSDKQAQRCLRKLIELMEKEKPFKDCEFNLAALASRLSINRTYLSQIINEHTGKSFTDFINDFRLEEAKKMINEGLKKERSILDICFEAGFNSKSSFYRVFKRATGLTPIEYRQKIFPL